MAVSLNSVISFNSRKLQVNHENVSRYSVGPSIPRLIQFTSLFGTSGSRRFVKEKRLGLCLSVGGGNQLGSDVSEKKSETAERSLSDTKSLAVNPPSLDGSADNSSFQPGVNNESCSQTSEFTNGSTASSDQKLGQTSSSNLHSTSKKSPLTARERLRAARVLSRYTESKASKSDMGSNVLDALRESDRGKKRSRLPEAPTNMLDDSKRGMPKQGLTFQFPGGADLFVIVFSFVFISTVMFATTYVVWKVGAIHFNEY